MSAFEDPDFSGEAALDGVSVQDWRKPVQWRRGPEVAKSGAKLFGTIRADNIKQGELGDCWLLAAIAVLADYPGYIRNLFDETELTATGKYTIQLFDIKDGWQGVVIDDRLPCDKNGKTLFAAVDKDDDSLWAPLLEKAFAKFVGGYGNLAGGSAYWAWQVITGQPYQARITRKVKDGGIQWIFSELDGLRRSQTDPAAHLQWRSRSKASWKGPTKTVVDKDAFEEIATFSQANFAMCCSIDGGSVEGKREDGLLSRHEYSVLQVVEVLKYRLVEVRNPWGSGGEWNGKRRGEVWRMPPDLAAELAEGEPTDEDGRFWMPWEDFSEVFDGGLQVCPVTLACPRNSQVKDEKEEGADGRRRVGGRRCPQCRQPYTRSWVLLIDGSWKRIADGAQLCYLCLRATCRAKKADLDLAGVHQAPKTLNLAPPPAPRRLDICEYGPACYRRNPAHFRQYFHPSLLPPAPDCMSGCGRSAASGFQTCCRQCKSAPPDLRVAVSKEASGGSVGHLAGLYKPDSSGKGVAVWKNSTGEGWLWKNSCWMFAQDAGLVGTSRGSVASETKSPAPHLVENWQVPGGASGWKNEPGFTVKVEGGTAAECTHHHLCDERDKRESELTRKADDVLTKWRVRAAHRASASPGK